MSATLEAHSQDWLHFTDQHLLKSSQKKNCAHVSVICGTLKRCPCDFKKKIEKILILEGQILKIAIRYARF